jgi:uncharacterized protein
MLKWLLVIVVVAAVYFFFIKKKPLPSETPSKRKKDDHDDADMVACTVCGTYISLNEALLQNGEYFCSDDCRKA